MLRGRDSFILTAALVSSVYLYAQPTIAGDGSTIDGERVTERSVLAGGIVRIVTEKSGQDDRRPAMFRFTHLIGDSSFSRRKEVKLAGTADYFERHTYSWSR